MRYAFVATALVASVMATPMDLADDVSALTGGHGASSYGNDSPAAGAYGSPEWSSTCTEEMPKETAPVVSEAH